jgi:16S rRNA (guanine1207-N2)-methyltransferase
MSASRLSHALSSGGIALPSDGRIALFNPRAETDLAALPQDRLFAIQRHYPDHAALSRRGMATATEPEGRFAAAIVFLPRARAEGEALIAEAVAATDGPVIVDGQKTDGVDAMLKALRKRGSVSDAIAKAHGKCFQIAPGSDLTDWAAPAPTRTEDGFLTAPGVFSADGADPASRLLTQHLPTSLSGRAADFGAGWGYLSAELARRDGITELHLVEADHTAISCAQGNVTSLVAQFHWNDATTWTAPNALDVIVMNPPFHKGRAADPALGQAFIANAARNLAPTGRLYLVANRQLPYEATLEDAFADVDTLGADPRFKIFVAQRPTRPRR